jgi:hypothetical protein
VPFGRASKAFAKFVAIVSVPVWADGDRIDRVNFRIVGVGNAAFRASSAVSKSPVYAASKAGIMPGARGFAK